MAPVTPQFLFPVSVVCAGNIWDHDSPYSTHTRKKKCLHFWSLATKARATNEGTGPSPHYTRCLFLLQVITSCVLAFFSYNHGQTSWDTFSFLGHFPIHTGPPPPLTPQTMLDACIQNLLSLNFV